MSVGLTYPGTATPLRGLLAFTESDRDVFFGRDEQRGELARLVVGEGFRAGLLYGESGAGKTSLLRAGLIPHLRDQGVFVLWCDDPSDPMRSFANAMLAETGNGNRDGETPSQYLQRVVAEAMKGQMFLFVVDGLERVLDGPDELLTEFANLYQQVVSRSGGRARFLFACAAHKVYALGSLERKTGSLFPPSNRYMLEPFSTEIAERVLENTVSLAGLPCDPATPKALARLLNRRGSVLPADLQIAALAIRDLNITTPAAVEELGGPNELLRAWLLAAAARTGDQRSALRIIGELAHGDGLTPQSPDVLAARANVDPATTRQALASLQDSVVAEAVVVPGQPEPHYALVHALLAGPSREISAPARETARVAFELLGSKADSGGRLDLREWIKLRRDAISPATPEEAAVVERTKRFYYAVLAGVAAAPILVLIILYIALSGHYYLDLGRPTGGGKKSVVVRQGRPGLSAFFWLPGGYGEIIADTGYTRAMVPEKQWSAIDDEEFSGDDDGMAYVEAALARLDPSIRAQIAYARTGDEKALEVLAQSAETPTERVALFSNLAPIGRGTRAEMKLLEDGLTAADPSVQTAALSVITSGARRAPEAWNEALVKVLTAPNPELRRLALTAVRRLPSEQSGAVLGSALSAASDPVVRRELTSAAGSAAISRGPSPAAATAILRDRGSSAGARERARAELERAFRSAPKAAVAATAALAGESDAPPEQRVYALELLYEQAPEDSLADIRTTAAEARESKSEEVQAAALPLFARIDSSAAAGDLVLMLDRELSPALRKAVALSWGEVAKKDSDAAITALEPLLDDRHPDVRAAAARAYGYTGKSTAQARLIKMVKGERYDVAIGAAYGLANSAAVGGSRGTAVGGIYHLWKRRGAPRRMAAQVYAYLARTRPRSAFNYLSASARSRDDDELHPIGVRGLCNAYAAGYQRAARELARAADDDSVAVRRLVIQCLVDHQGELGGTEERIAAAMSRDSDATIRADAATVLARLAKPSKTSKRVIAALSKLAQDKDRSARMTAIRTLAQLGEGVPEEVVKSLPQAFRSSPESDKLEILAASRQLGSGELVGAAVADPSAPVRIAAIDTAIATRTEIGPTLNAALTDPDPGVRSAALERIARGVPGLAQTKAEAALRLAIRDDSEAISDLALATLARVADSETALAELGARLNQRSERSRAQAARAAAGLAESDAAAAAELLDDLQEDPSHDVRVAVVPALGKAMAMTLEPAELGARLRRAEKNATRRWIALAALLTLAESDSGKSAAIAELEKVGKGGPPLARHAAQLGLGLIEARADGIAFVQKLVP